jgi:ferritin-like protein
MIHLDPGQEWNELVQCLIKQHGATYTAGYLMAILTKVTNNDRDLQKELTARLELERKKVR